MAVDNQPSGNTRRLKAIMFTDIKGYSAMMGEDESLAVKLVLEHREIVRDCLTRYEGQEHETIGDAFVVLFDSVVNAVRCAAEIQQKLKTRNSGLPVDQQVWLRIGVHLGDIIVQGDGIYGDGVNVAARVQDKAEPGGISITEQVFLQVDGKLDYAMEAVGKVELKNIKNPPHLYKLRMDGSKVPVPVRVHRMAVVGAAAAVVVLLALLVWTVLRPQGSSTETVALRTAGQLAIPAPPGLSDQQQARKTLAGQKIAEAMAASGAQRMELLRQALALDPDNTAVQTMLAASMSAEQPAPGGLAAAPTAVAVPAGTGPAGAVPQAASPAAPAALGSSAGARAGDPRPSKIKAKAAATGDHDQPRIQRAIVVE